MGDADAHTVSATYSRTCVIKYRAYSCGCRQGIRTSNYNEKCQWSNPANAPRYESLLVRQHVLRQDAASITEEYARYIPRRACEIVASGGGVGVSLGGCCGYLVPLDCVVDGRVVPNASGKIPIANTHACPIHKAIKTANVLDILIASKYCHKCTLVYEYNPTGGPGNTPLWTIDSKPTCHHRCPDHNQKALDDIVGYTKHKQSMAERSTPSVGASATAPMTAAAAASM